MPLPSNIPRLAGRGFGGSLDEFRHDRLAFQRRLHTECGDIAAVRLGPVSVVSVNASELAQQVLVEKADHFVKSRGLRLARVLLGDGLLTSEHEHHRRQRKLIAPTFQPRRIAAYGKAMVELGEQRAASFADGSTVDVAEEMMSLTLAIVGRTLFSADVTGEAKEIGEALTVANRYVSEMVARPHWPLWVPTATNRQLKQAIRRLDDVVYRIIAERRASGVDTGDMLSMLLLAREEEDSSKGMSDAEARDEAMTFFLAGHETMANALAWSLYLLARHPEAQSRLQEEVDRVLGGRSPTVEDLPRLPYALQVFKETMRLYPPAYIVGRKVDKTVRIGSFVLPSGTVVLINIYAMHYRHDYFADPERFLPERFAADKERSMRSSSFIPFGGGPRICIGNHFALMEGPLVLATLAQRLAVAMSCDDKIEPEPLITLRPRGAMKMRISRRDHRFGDSAQRSAST